MLPRRWEGPDFGATITTEVDWNEVRPKAGHPCSLNTIITRIPLEHPLFNVTTYTMNLRFRLPALFLLVAVLLCPSATARLDAAQAPAAQRDDAFEVTISELKAELKAEHKAALKAELKAEMKAEMKMHSEKKARKVDTMGHNRGFNEMTRILNKDLATPRATHDPHGTPHHSVIRPRPALQRRRRRRETTAAARLAHSQEVHAQRAERIAEIEKRISAARKQAREAEGLNADGTNSASG